MAEPVADLVLEKLSNGEDLHPVEHPGPGRQHPSNVPESRSADCVASGAVVDRLRVDYRRIPRAAAVLGSEVRRRSRCVQRVRLEHRALARLGYQNLFAALASHHATSCRGRSCFDRRRGHHRRHGLRLDRNLHHRRGHRRTRAGDRSVGNYARMDRDGSTTTDTSRCRCRS